MQGCSNIIPFFENRFSYLHSLIIIYYHIFFLLCLTSCVHTLHIITELAHRALYRILLSKTELPSVSLRILAHVIFQFDTESNTVSLVQQLYFILYASKLSGIHFQHENDQSKLFS